MTTKLLSAIMAFAFRRARRAEGRIWWIVLAVAALARVLDRRSQRESSERYTVRPGETLEVRVNQRANS